MRAGRLDRRITIEQRTVTRNDYGEEIKSWATLAELWAEKRPDKAVTAYAAQQRYASASVAFRVRWFPLIPTVTSALADYRITLDGRTYNILGIEEIGRREGAHIICETRTDQGGTP